MAQKRPPPDEMPARCQECAKPSRPVVHAKCDLCRNLGFPEEFLCDLNRSVQKPGSLECHAFQPKLKLVGQPGQKLQGFPENTQDPSPEAALRKLLDSDKIKYQRALALQKMACDPDDVFVSLKYHFAWNVSRRRLVFEQSGNFIDFISDMLLDFSEEVGGLVSLLWLAPDHLHLYVESDGESSVEKIAQQIKRGSASSILAQVPDLKGNTGKKGGLWDKAYFVETIS
jgi:REP element-mobilizing transposase RayT